MSIIYQVWWGRVWCNDSNEVDTSTAEVFGTKHFDNFVRPKQYAQKIIEIYLDSEFHKFELESQPDYEYDIPKGEDGGCYQVLYKSATDKWHGFRVEMTSIEVVNNSFPTVEDVFPEEWR